MNRALRAVPPHSVVVVLPSHAALLLRLAGEATDGADRVALGASGGLDVGDALLASGPASDRDLFMAYARLAHAYGCEGDFVLSLPPPPLATTSTGGGHADAVHLPIPIVVFDVATYNARGAFDLRFQFQGARAGKNLVRRTFSRCWVYSRASHARARAC